MKRFLVALVLTLLTLICLSPVLRAAPRAGGGHAPRPMSASMPRPAAPRYTPAPKTFKPMVYKPTTTNYKPTVYKPTTTIKKPTTYKPALGKDHHITGAKAKFGKDTKRAVLHHDYHKKHGHRFAHGWYYRGRHHGHWTKRCFHKTWGCWMFYCPSACGWFYWHSAQACYYPISYIVVSPPVAQLSAEAAETVVPPAAINSPVATGEIPEVPEVPGQIEE